MDQEPQRKTPPDYFKGDPNLLAKRREEQENRLRPKQEIVSTDKFLPNAVAAKNRGDSDSIKAIKDRLLSYFISKSGGN